MSGPRGLDAIASGDGEAIYLASSKEDGVSAAIPDRGSRWHTDGAFNS